MSFSNEWEAIYSDGGRHQSVWPWSDLISLYSHYEKDRKIENVLELGAGGGANIPFLLSKGVNYYGIEGSKTQVAMLNEKYGKDCVIVSGDFTESIPFDITFDLVVDRSSLTCNPLDSITRAINCVSDHLCPQGLFMGVDWFSTNCEEYAEVENEGTIIIDKYTRKYEHGFYAGMGNCHFSDAEHILDLFKDYRMLELFEKTKTWVTPDKKPIARWNFVAEKN